MRSPSSPTLPALFTILVCTGCGGSTATSHSDAGATREDAAVLDAHQNQGLDAPQETSSPSSAVPDGSYRCGGECSPGECGTCSRTTEYCVWSSEAPPGGPVTAFTGCMPLPSQCIGENPCVCLKLGACTEADGGGATEFEPQ
jgi:hypothetical protein